MPPPARNLPLLFFIPLFIYLFDLIYLILTLSSFKLRLAARSPSRCPSPWPPAPPSPVPDHIVTGLDPRPRAKRNRGCSTSSPPSACFRLVLLPTRPRAPPNSRPYTEWGYQICPLISFIISRLAPNQPLLLWARLSRLLAGTSALSIQGVHIGLLAYLRPPRSLSSYKFHFFLNSSSLILITN